MKKRIFSFMLALVMLVGLLPTSAFAFEPEKTVITEIVATYEFVQPTYGEQIKRPEMVYTVEGDIPVSLESSSFDWFWWDGTNWTSIRTGYFVDGTWCHDVNVKLTDTENYEFAPGGATLIINGVEWGKTSGGWKKSPGFEIAHIPGALTLALCNPDFYAVPFSYVGVAIEPFSFVMGAFGGTKPYTFSKSGGSDWLTVSEDGTLTGTPTQLGSNDQIYVTVTDALGAEASLAVQVGKTFVQPKDREVVSRVVGTVAFPEIVCGYELRGGDFNVTVIEGSPARITTNSSDFYPVDGEGNRGSSVDVVTGGNAYVMDILVGIENEDGRTHVLDKDNLEVIINGKETTYGSVSVGESKSSVWVYTAPFTVEHVFDNDTDATCNGCDFTREGCDHQYDNACDTDCNVCDAVREVPHEYSGICDTDCNLCGEERTAAPHTFTDCYDDWCNVCGTTRPRPTHTFDDCEDDTCNLCEETRRTPAHTYDNLTDTTCNICGEPRTLNTISLNETKLAQITYGGEMVDYVFTPTFTGEFIFTSHHADSSLDTVCYVLDTDGDRIWMNDDDGGNRQFKIQETFTAGKTYILRVKYLSNTLTGELPFSISCVHDYEDECDDHCEICDFTREAPHAYEDECDADCNACEAVREPVHDYNGACDSDCGACGQTRVPGDHTYINCEDDDCEYCSHERETAPCVWNDCFDGECNVCGHTRSVPTHTYSDLADAVCNVCEASRTLNYITVGETKEYDLEAGEHVDFVFECTVSGRYLYRSHGSSDKDTYGYILSSDGEMIESDDDSMGDRQFGMEYDFVAGETYVLRARFYSENLSRTICVSLSCTEHIYDNDGDAQCNACGETREVAAYTVSGTVSGAEEGAEVSVSLYAQGAPEPAYNTTVTGSGNYSIADVLPGSYTVKAVSAGCEDYTAAVTVTDSNVTHDIAMTKKASTVTVNGVGDIDYTVNGNVITVDHEMACKVGYLDDGEYVSIAAVANGDGTYSFTAPAGVTQVLLVVKGDANGDGNVNSADSMAIARSLQLTTKPAYQALTAIQTFAADLDNTGAVNTADSMMIARSLQLTTHPAYQALSW